LSRPDTALDDFFPRGIIRRMDSMPPETPRPPDAHRRMLWWTFWLLFLSTPVLVIAGPMLAQKFSIAGFRGLTGLYGAVEVMCAFLGGAFGAGFVLAKLHSVTTAQFIRRGIGFGLAIVVTYIVIAGVGCAVLLSANR
jgi:hypothetical protein